MLLLRNTTIFWKFGTLFSFFLLFSVPCLADVLISLKPSSTVLQNIEKNLLKAFDKLNPPQPIPPWLKDYKFSDHSFHVSLGYIKNKVWKEKHSEIVPIINKAVEDFLNQNGKIQFTFHDIKTLGDYIVIEPNDATKTKLENLNLTIHKALTQKGFSEGLGGSKGWGLPQNFLPHLSIAKTADLKAHAEASWNKRKVNYDFDTVIKKYVETVKTINQIEWCKNPPRPQGYSFRFDTIDVSDRATITSIVKLP